MPGKYFQPPDAAQAHRVPPGQLLAKGFPVLTYGETPQISQESWQCPIWGLASEVAFRWSDVMVMPQRDFTADFHCVTTWSKLDVVWRGVRGLSPSGRPLDQGTV